MCLLVRCWLPTPTKRIWKHWMHFLLSSSKVGALTTSQRDRSWGSPPPCLTAVQTLLDISVSALYSEDEPQPNLMMYEKPKTFLSGEPQFWGGYLELPAAARGSLSVLFLSDSTWLSKQDSASFGSHCGTFSSCCLVGATPIALP